MSERGRTPVPVRTPVPKRWMTGGSAPPRSTGGGAPPREPRPPRPDPARSPDVLTFLLRALAYEVWVIAVTGVAVTLFLFVAIGSGITDVYLQVRGVGPTSGHVAQVTISDEALYLWDPAERGGERTPRGMLAEIVAVLDRAGADVVVLDVLLDAPDAEDGRLAQAARAHGSVIAAERFELAEPAADLYFQPGVVPAFDGAIAGGFANLYQRTTILSQDLLVRGAPLVKRVTRVRAEGPWPGNLVGAVQDEGAVVPSLALAAAWTFRRHREGLPARLVELEEALRAGCPGEGALSCAVDLPDLGLPDAPGALHDVLAINFRAAEHSDPLPTVRAADILRFAGQAALMRQLDPTLEPPIPDAWREALQGRVVVVGRAGEGDRFITPFGFPAYLRADMAGLRVQAQLVDTLLSGRHVRPVGWPAWALAAGLGIAVFRTFRRVSDAVHFAGWSAAAVGLVMIGAWVFRWTDGLMVDMGPAAVGIFGVLFAAHLRSWVLEQRGET